MGKKVGMRGGDMLKWELILCISITNLKLRSYSKQNFKNLLFYGNVQIHANVERIL